MSWLSYIKSHFSESEEHKQEAILRSKFIDKLCDMYGFEKPKLESSDEQEFYLNVEKLGRFLETQNFPQKDIYKAIEKAATTAYPILIETYSFADDKSIKAAFLHNIFDGEESLTADIYAEGETSRTFSPHKETGIFSFCYSKDKDEIIDAHQPSEEELAIPIFDEIAHILVAE